MTANSTKSYRAALAAVACGAVVLGTAPVASAAPMSAASVRGATAAQQAAMAVAAKKVIAAAEAAMAKRVADAKAAAVKQAAADDAAATKQAAADALVAAEKAAAEAVADAKKAADKTAAAKKAAQAAAKQATAEAKAAKQAANAAAKKTAKQAAAESRQAAAEARQARKTAKKAAKKDAKAQQAEAAAQNEAEQEAADAAAKAAADAKAATDALRIPDAPIDLTVRRSTANLNDFTVSWSKPTGAVDRYDVTVYVDGTITKYSTKTTTLDLKGRSLDSVYRIKVAARDSQDRGAISTVVLAPVVPGAPSGLITSAVSAAAGIALFWAPPTRSGLSGIDHYRVLLRDKTTGDEVVLKTTETAAVFSDADPKHLFEATVTAVTRDGDGLPMTVDIGDLTSTSPRGFTAIRDPLTPTEVNLAWSPPVWLGSDPITSYEVGVRSSNRTVWTEVGLTEAVTLPLALDESASYSVRALNASGQSSASDAEVDLVVATQLPSSSAPVVLSTADQQVDVALYGWVGDSSLDELVITLTDADGTRRGEQGTLNGSDGVAFRDIAAGGYNVTVVGHDTETGDEAALFDGTIKVDGDATSSSSAESSFDAGVGYWHGVYPGRHLPRVVSTEDVSFEGSGSMAITATWDSTKSNVTAGTSGFGGIPVRAKQPVTVSALGRPGTPSNWNMGISWWDADGKQISLVRAKRVTGVVNVWQPSRSTYTAPAGAVSATAFVEIGGLKMGDTFYVDGITITSK